MKRITHIFLIEITVQSRLQITNVQYISMNDYKKVEKDVEDIFNKRFEPLNKFKCSKLGYVDFLLKGRKTKNKDMNLKYKLN